MRLPLLIVVCAATACAPRRPAPADPSIAARATLVEADALVRAGCFDCLTDALQRYESVRAVAAVGAAAYYRPYGGYGYGYAPPPPACGYYPYPPCY